MKNILLLIITFTVFAQIVIGQNYQLADSKVFKPQDKKILLFADQAKQQKVILYFSKLRVNTDGSPRSYNPDDLSGTVKAINNICNGMSVYEKEPNGTLKILPNGEKSKLTCADAKVVFQQFRANNWVEPPGYSISWGSVIAKNSLGKPCIFKNETQYVGFFGSLTSVKNGLSANNQGECGYKNQLDALVIPNLVLPAKKWEDESGVVHNSPLQEFGAKKEDIVFAYNPDKNTWSYAIIGDGGPSDNLGEGSVALNMKLMAKTANPANYTEAKKLDTGNTRILVAIIPNSGSYSLVKPYTQQNIETRGRALLKEMGFSDEVGFIAFLNQQKSRF